MATTELTRNTFAELAPALTPSDMTRLLNAFCDDPEQITEKEFVKILTVIQGAKDTP